MIDRNKYRKLAGLETIREADLYLFQDQLRPVSQAIGLQVHAAAAHFPLVGPDYYREVRLDSPGWRYLDEGELLDKDDQLHQLDFSGERWSGVWIVLGADRVLAPFRVGLTDGRVGADPYRRIMRRRWPEAQPATVAASDVPRIPVGATVTTVPVVPAELMPLPVACGCGKHGALDPDPYVSHRRWQAGQPECDGYFGYIGDPETFILTRGTNFAVGVGVSARPPILVFGPDQTGDDVA